MQKLERRVAPVCLKRYKHGRDKWGVVEESCRSEIWLYLEQMQGQFCAYCERPIKRAYNDAHIEHFYRRDSSPKLTFSWSNIFGSCNVGNSCGRYKDNDKTAKQIDLNKVCKPDVRDPHDLLMFLPNGKIKPKLNLSLEDIEVAQNTINVFNLNNSSLVGRRRILVKQWKTEALDLISFLEEYPADIDVLNELEELRESYAPEGFYSAICSVV